MPSPEKPQSQSDLAPDGDSTISLDSKEISFVDIFADLPEQNTLRATNPSIRNITDFDIGPEGEASLINIGDQANVDETSFIDTPIIDSPDVVEEFALEETIVENEGFENLEFDLAETVEFTETTKGPPLGVAYASEMTTSPQNLRDISPQDIKRNPASNLTVTGQDIANARPDPAKDEISFEDLPRYVKSVGESKAPPQDNIKQIQPFGIIDKDGNIPQAQSSTSASAIAPASSSLLQPTPVLQGQPNLQQITVPMREVVQNVVQATLKQERTLIRIDPPELGRIQLDFDHSGSGKTIVTLSAETDSVKLMLMERRAFMVSLFEGYGLDDVEIQMGNKFDSDARSSNSQFFSEREDSTHFEDQSDSLTSSDSAEDDFTKGITSHPVSNFQPNNSRLHIRV